MPKQMIIHDIGDLSGHTLIIQAGVDEEEMVRFRQAINTAFGEQGVSVLVISEDTEIVFKGLKQGFWKRLFKRQAKENGSV